MPICLPVNRDIVKEPRPYVVCHCPWLGIVFFRRKRNCGPVIVLVLLLLASVSGTSGQEPPKSPGSHSAQLPALEDDAERLSSSGAESSDVKQLIADDAELRDQTGQAAKRIQQTILVALAKKGTADALEYLRSVFETQTHRRHDAAHAISIAALIQPANDQDWRYLVRSLTVVEGEQAVSVLHALTRFRRRATKPAWVRQVILVALSLPEQDLPAALKLLKFWTQHAPAKQASSKEQLADYQAWFRRSYPHEPSPVLPVDVPGSRWTCDRLSGVLADVGPDQTSVAAGALVYFKADCHKCHRRGDMEGQPKNDQLGPDLTSLGWRRQRKEILTAILYPSHHLNDDYPMTTVVLKSGKSVSGLMMPDDRDGLKVVSSDGKATRFGKTDIDEMLESNMSNMPAGLLEPLSQREIHQLMAFLSAQVGDGDLHEASGQ